MKLVEILGKELKDWPAGVEELGQCYDGDLHICRGGAPTPEYLGIYVSECDDMEEKVSRAQWQAERDRQKGGEWKRHRAGRNQPVDAGVRVEVKLRCGDIQQGNAHEFIWLHSECDVDANIMQYRVISQPQAEEVKLSKAEVRAQFMPEPEFVYLEANTDQIDITDNFKVDQIDGPIKWRDTVNELDAYIEEFTREREALINRLALEGFALIPAMTPVMGVADIDFSDWRNWKAGDVLESMEQSMDIKLGGQYILSEDPFNEGDITFKDDAGDIRGRHADEYKFIRRP